MTTILTGILTTAALAGAVLALAALGGMLANGVGVLNLGLEGLMALGGITGIITVSVIPNPYVGFLAALLVGALFGAIFAFATVVLQASQVLCGLALTIAGAGIAGTVGPSYAGQHAGAVFQGLKVPLLSDIPILGPALFSQNVLIYLAFVILPVGFYVLLYRTRHGMNMRAVGENPAAADAAGIPVRWIRFVYVTIGSAVSATSGAYLTLAFIPSWSEGITAGRGWISVALVIFAGYQPIHIAIGALLFGCVSALSYVGQAQNWAVPSAILSMLPYIATLAAMMIPKLFLKNMRAWGAAPQALGTAYFRDQR
jgi:general nucleoside transport system permease protein